MAGRTGAGQPVTELTPALGKVRYQLAQLLVHGHQPGPGSRGQSGEVQLAGRDCEQGQYFARDRCALAHPGQSSRLGGHPALDGAEDSLFGAVGGGHR